MPDKEENDKSKKPGISRREALKKELKLQDEEELDMPPIDAPHLISHLFEIGPTMSGGMGPAPLSHAEISAWQRNTGIELQAWEARFIKRLSIEYVGEAHEATARDRLPPWREAPYARTAPNQVAERMKQSIREMKKL